MYWGSMNLTTSADVMHIGLAKSGYFNLIDRIV